MTLQHSGVKGMRWGDRRYQNLDGSLTPAGRLRYLSITKYGGNRSLAKNSDGSYAPAHNSNGNLSITKYGGNSLGLNSGGNRSIVKQATPMPDKISITKLSLPENMKRSKAVRSMGLI